jgi:hypothetical protein
VQKLLPAAQMIRQVGRRRGYVGGCFRGATGSANPVLGPAELPGCGVVIAGPGHQLPVQFPHEPERQRQGFQALEAVLQRGDVVADLAQVFRVAPGAHAGVRREQFAERRLGALDAARIHRFPLHERADQQVWIGQSPSLARQSAHQLIGVGKRPNQPRRPEDFGRQRAGLKSPVAFARPDPASGRFPGRGGFHPRKQAGPLFPANIINGNKPGGPRRLVVRARGRSPSARDVRGGPDAPGCPGPVPSPVGGAGGVAVRGRGAWGGTRSRG